MKFGMDHRTGRLNLGKWSLAMPRSRVGRIATGSALVVGGTLGFLPILGFWMIPLGLVVLSHDLPHGAPQAAAADGVVGIAAEPPRDPQQEPLRGLAADGAADALSGPEGGIGQRGKINRRQSQKQITAEHGDAIPLDHVEADKSRIATPGNVLEKGMNPSGIISSTPAVISASPFIRLVTTPVVRAGMRGRI